MRKPITLPILQQTKQCYNCLLGLTVMDGYFSLWNGHRPMKLAPPFLSCT